MSIYSENWFYRTFMASHFLRCLLTCNVLLIMCYLDFEKITGWQLSSTYDPIPEALHAELKAFFRPINEQLFSWLGVRYDSWSSMHS